MTEQPEPIPTPEPGYELCYECDGKRRCWLCSGDQVLASGDRCGECTGRGWCIVCGGAGELVAGARARYAPSSLESTPVAPLTPGQRTASTVGGFRELGYDDGPALAAVRGKRPAAHQAEVVAYLRAAPLLVTSPGLVKDAFDGKTLAGKRSMRTDGVYAWPDSLAYYVERHQVELPAAFEAHMAQNHWRVPVPIDLTGLRPG